ncbi:MAG: prepilin-type N-terminal cleavage/methylation domain-containing protein [Verrucomicrobiia bacterium]
MSLIPPCPPRRRSPQGFTLIEVIVSISVLVIVSSSVFLIMRTALEASTALESTQLEFQRQETLRRVLDRMFRELPATVRLTALAREGDAGATQIELAPFDPLEPWRPTRDPLKEAALTLQEQANSLYTFGVRLRDPELRAFTASPAEGTEFFPLMRDVRLVTWRFFSADTQEWLASWTSAATRPALIEFTWQPGDGTPPQRWIFRVAPAQAVPETES